MKKVKDLVSVIISTKNSSKTLVRCLNSIIDQSYRQIEILIIDNNSSDNTKVISKKYNIKVFNHGFERSSQRNFGAKLAKGNYLYFVDSDFILNKKVITECIYKIKDYDAIVVHNSPDIRISWIAKIRKFEVDMYKYDLTYSAARFFKKNVFFDIGGYNEKLIAGEDYDLQNKLNKKEYKTGFIESENLHIGEPRSLLKHMLKYYYYGKDFVNYKEYNNLESKKQLSFIRLPYLKNWKKFIFHPGLGICFLCYHTIKFIFGGLGYFSVKFLFKIKKYSQK